MNLTEQMTVVLDRWDESGLSLRAFAQRDDHSYAKLLYWREKLRGVTKRTRPRKLETPLKRKPKALVPVRVVEDEHLATPERRKGFDVRLGNGLSVEVAIGFDELELRRLIGVLTQC